MIKAIFVILAIVVSVHSNLTFLENDDVSARVSGLFVKFLNQHNKRYSSEELSERFLIFVENIKNHGIHLLSEKNPKFSPFYDLSEKEFRQLYLTLRTDDLIHTGEQLDIEINDDVPTNFDWRDHGAVTPVKDQGECGSCWTFSTTGNIEGINAIKKGVITQLSESQILDCDNVNEGCYGGWMHQAMIYVKDNGIESEIDYPYVPLQGNCKHDKSKVAVRIDGYKFITNNRRPRNEDEIKAILYQNGPLSVAVDAGSFQFYTGGIFDLECSKILLNHAVLIVGYGETSKGTKFWVIKNSWGSLWGEHGYIRLIRGKGKCGVNTYVVTAVIK
jgi:cathepsin F